MAIIRKKDIQTMSEAEITKQISEIRQSLMSEKAKMAAGGLPENAGKMREMKKTIARLYTVAGEKKYKV